MSPTALIALAGALLVQTTAPMATAAAPEGQPGPMRRLALLVSHPTGGPDTETLRYSERDVAKVASVLTELGGFSADDVTILSAPTADELLGGLARVARRVDAARADGAQPLLLFYYSGHAASGELRLGDTRLPLATLKRHLAHSSAQIRIAFLDACQSGAITRVKGGRRAPSFVVDVEPGRASRGSVFITSSSAEEASQESDDLRGSFFTHHLVSGLRGAADRSDDAAVSLDEAYAYAYHRTVSHTAGTRGGTQHPTYTYDLQGNGDVALTRLGGRGALLFPPGGEGSYLVYDRGRDVVVGELDKTSSQSRRLSVPPGRYVVKKRGRRHLLLQDVRVDANGQRVVDEGGFREVPFEDDVTKGPSWLSARRSQRRRWAWTAALGVQSFFDAPTRASLFHPSGLVGLRAEWLNGVAPDLSLQLDVAVGAAAAVVRAGHYEAPTPVDFAIVLGGIGLDYGLWLGDRVLLQVGPRLTAVYAQRTFDPSEGLPRQDLFTISPGVAAGLGWRLGGVTLGLEARAHYLHYSTETDDQSLGFGEAYLCVGYTP